MAGAAIDTGISEVTSAFMHVSTMLNQKLTTGKSMFRVPKHATLGKLFVGGFAVQLRSIAQNITFLAGPGRNCSKRPQTHLPTFAL